MTDIQLEQVLPGDIERRSFEIIQEELSLQGIHLKPENEMVIKRAIHTTADFDYAQNLVFSGQAVKRGTEALKAGAVIVTDTNMGLSGINKKRLSALGGEAFCFMADEDVALQAKEQGTTRAVASMEKAARLYGLQGRPLIFAVGNAPTALVCPCFADKVPAADTSSDQHWLKSSRLLPMRPTNSRDRYRCTPVPAWTARAAKSPASFSCAKWNTMPGYCFFSCSSIRTACSLQSSAPSVQLHTA